MKSDSVQHRNNWHSSKEGRVQPSLSVSVRPRALVLHISMNLMLKNNRLGAAVNSSDQQLI